MNKSDNSKSITVHRRVKSVSSVDRSQVKRPAAKATSMSKQSDSSVAVKMKKSSPAPAKSKMISHFSSTMPSNTSIGVKVVKKSSSASASTSTSTSTTTTTKTKASSSEQVVMHPMLKTARARMQERRMVAVTPRVQPSQAAMNARELKEIAIKKALAAAERKTEQEKVKPHKLHFSFGRVLIALGCTAAAIFAIVYFINLNVSDFSLYAAAKQAGIESANKEPRVPQHFAITNISSENGKIEIYYKNTQNGETMMISEEKSSWDSEALLSNFVRNTYLSAFATIREQGLTIYISESNACWVNGGIVYKITAPAGSLDKKQIRQIATSM